MADDTHARIAVAVTAQEASDLARLIVGDISNPATTTTERIRAARRVRLVSLALVDRAVIAAVMDGESWESVAAAIGMDEDAAERRYAPVLPSAWVDGTPDWADGDLARTADALDLWWTRHAEPWETPAEHPVSSLLVDGT